MSACIAKQALQGEAEIVWEQLTVQASRSFYLKKNNNHDNVIKQGTCHLTT
jgi:predicted CoA-binding protein